MRLSRAPVTLSASHPCTYFGRIARASPYPSGTIGAQSGLWKLEPPVRAMSHHSADPTNADRPDFSVAFTFVVGIVTAAFLALAL